MTYNIVEVVPGKYAIRRRTFLENLFNVDGEFRDLYAVRGDYWWNSSSGFFNDCLTSDLDLLLPMLASLKTKPKVIA